MKAILNFLLIIAAATINCFSVPNVINGLSPATLTDSLRLPADIRVPFIKVLGKHLRTGLLFNMPKNNAIIMSMAFSIDQNGKVDKVYFSKNLSDNNFFVVNSKIRFTNDLKNILINEHKYHNKVLILLVLFKRPEDNNIANLNDFLGDYSSLWPLINKDETLNKQVVFLQPFINNFFDPVE